MCLGTCLIGWWTRMGRMRACGGSRCATRSSPLARLAASRVNPFRAPVREIRLRIESGKILRILSNDIDATADDIAALYKRRWQVELFFRWIKQTLNIKHFLGTSENAVRIQLAVSSPSCSCASPMRRKQRSMACLPSPASCAQT
jgi:transposase